jgi:hypothetical protein
LPKLQKSLKNGLKNFGGYKPKIVGLYVRVTWREIMRAKERKRGRRGRERERDST